MAMSAPPGIHGHQLEVTVVAACKLKNMPKISKQYPYVRLDYESTKYRTRTCKGGGKNPTFNEKFTITLIEGVREIYIVVWNSNTFRSDDFIGSARAPLNRVLSCGFDELTVPIQTENREYAGEVKLILHFPHVLQSAARRNEATALQYNHAQTRDLPPFPSPVPYPGHSPAHALHHHSRYHVPSIYPSLEPLYPLVYPPPSPAHYYPACPFTPNHPCEAPAHYPQPELFSSNYPKWW